jgi:hypothetical protein
LDSGFPSKINDSNLGSPLKLNTWLHSSRPHRVKSNNTRLANPFTTSVSVDDAVDADEDEDDDDEDDEADGGGGGMTTSAPMAASRAASSCRRGRSVRLFSDKYSSSSEGSQGSSNWTSAQEEIPHALRASNRSAFNDLQFKRYLEQ